MSRSPSRLLRALRFAVGLVTVWCLGCSGYEPLIDSILGTSDRGMQCGGARASSASASDSAQMTIGAAAGTHSEFECGCGQSCHGVSPSLAVAQGVRFALPTHGSSNVDAPASISRAPLLPPPESRLL